MQKKTKFILYITFFIYTLFVIEIVLLVNQNKQLVSIIQNDNRFAKINLKLKQKVPDFQGYTADGDTISFYRIQDSKILIIFFSTTCPACTIDIPTWQKISAANIQNLNILGICLSNKNETMHFVMENKLNFDVIVDPEKIIARKLNVSSIPSKILVNSEKKIEYFIIGSGQKDKNEILEKKILNEE